MDAKSISRSASYVLAAMVVILVASLLWVAPQAYADGVQYVSRSFSYPNVATETKACTSYARLADMNGDEELYDGWWYVADESETYGTSDRWEVLGTANLIIKNGVTIKCKDGIHVPAGSTLNIYFEPGESGRLEALCDTNSVAAIGGDSGEAGGTVNIHGGTVVANAYNDNEGEDGAGIGGGNKGSGGTVTIYGGTIEATGANYGAGIGSGDADSASKHGGSLTVYGGNVTAKGGTDAAGIGGGEGASGATVEIWGGSVNATGGQYGAGIGSGDKDGTAGNGGSTTIHAGTVTAQGGSDSAGIGGGCDVSGGSVTINGGTVTATGSGDGSGIGGGDCGTSGTIKIAGGDVTGTGGANGAGIGGGNDRAWDTIEITGGWVHGNGGAYAAGIGGGDRDSLTEGGTIIISGTPHVFARGGTDAAGIGGGEETTGGNITISGGDLTVQGGTNGAGIGGGDGAAGGTITISGGTVSTTGGSNGDSYGGAGVGGGDGAAAGTIRISSDADVTAQGGAQAAGIGTGRPGGGGSVTIEGGTVHTTGGRFAAGIGSGHGGNADVNSEFNATCTPSITIAGGEVTAVGGDNAAGIGGGMYAHSGKIVIDGGTVEATGGVKGGSGIGSGYNCCTQKGITVDITINGGNVTAEAGDSGPNTDNKNSNEPGAAIGAGGEPQYAIKPENQSYFNGNIYFNGGQVKALAAAAGPNAYFNLRAVGGNSAHALEYGTGSVFFNGATVEMHTGINSNGNLSQAVFAKNENVHIKDASDTHQRVVYDGTTASKDDRVTTLTSEGKQIVVVEPCTHDGATCTDKDADVHSCTCTHCGFDGDEAHTWSDKPTWAWAENQQSATATFTCVKCERAEAVNATVSQSEVDGKVVLTATATFQGKEYRTTYKEAEWAKFTYSLSLQDCICINFYMRDLEDAPGNYTVAYGAGPDQTADWTVATPTDAASNCYVIANCAAKEMGDEVHVIVKHGGDVIKDDYYSVKRYCDEVIGGGYDEGFKDLCRAALDYGSYAQKAFNYETDKLVNGGNDYFVNTGIAVPAYGAAKEDKSESVTGVTLSLVTTAKTQLVARFKCGAASAEGYSATVDGGVADVSLDNGKLKVVVEGIAAKDLAAKRAIVLTCPDGTYTFTVSPVDYMGLAVSKESQVELNRAFYNYHVKAAAFAAGGGEPAVLNRAPSSSLAAASI